MKTRTEQIVSERADYDKVLTKLESLTKSQELMADALHKLRNAIVQRLEPPADLLRVADAAKRCGTSVTQSLNRSASPGRCDSSSRT